MGFVFTTWAVEDEGLQLYFSVVRVDIRPGTVPHFSPSLLHHGSGTRASASDRREDPAYQPVCLGTKWGLSGWLPKSPRMVPPPCQYRELQSGTQAMPTPQPTGDPRPPRSEPSPWGKPVLSYSPGVHGGQTLSVVWAQPPPYQMKLLHFPAFRSISCELKAKLQTQRAGPYLRTP